MGAAALLAAGTALAWRPLRARSLDAQFRRAKRDFHWQRERLEAKFVYLAASQSRADLAAWDHCHFDDDVAYVRNRSNGELAAFSAFSLGVDVCDDRGRSPFDLLANLRAGTAVFRFDGRRWETDGHAILNLSPCEAIRFYRDDLEVVGQE
ncbi:MAG: hypothetical protein U1E05_19170 [Patescibacteria group bacterium]|nr:hypothetical protein [Patescibacteria group bacterium]